MEERNLFTVLAYDIDDALDELEERAGIKEEDVELVSMYPHGTGLYNFTFAEVAENNYLVVNYTI